MKARVSLDDPAVVDELCARLSEGRAMYEACSGDDMPDDATVYRRMARDADFAATIARAREAQQDAEADKILKLADEATAENWQVKKLQIWARQWRMAKLAPKRFGDKLELDHKGSVEHRHTPTEAREKVEDFLSRKQAEKAGDPATKH
jgi:hypothetical protein